MKCHIPEISWHNREPVLSVDFQRVDGEIRRLATAGVDRHVLIWYIKTAAEGVVNVEFVADLVRHDHSVNVVRFNPTGELLASGDDDGQIFVWRKVDKGPSCAPNIFKDENSEDKENWTSACTLRGHIKDVYDLCWSPDGNHLISGSVDNSAILWDVQKGKSIAILSDHRGFVQGVAWDPLDKLVATLCSDRCCRVYNLKTRRVLHKIHKTTLPDMSETNTASSTRQTRLFYDDTLKSFCRRLTFTPDGELLIAPTGIVETENENHLNVTYVFSRHNLSKPALYFPTKENYTTVVRCCPVLFHLRSNGSNSENKDTDAKPWEVETTMFKFPYRIVFAVATQNAVILYDTQQRTPFAHVSNIHFTGLTDMSWSDDGRILIVSSTDGYCSFVTFSENELGIPYKEDVSKYLPKAEVVSTTAVSGSPTTDKEKDVKPVKDVKKIKDIKKSPPVVPISSQPNVNKKRVSLITLFSPKLKSSIQVASKNTTQVELPSVSDKNNQPNLTNDSSLTKPVNADDEDSIEVTYDSKKPNLTAQVSNMAICGATQNMDDTTTAVSNETRLLEKQSKTVPLPEPMEIDDDTGNLKEKAVNEKIEINQQDDICHEKQMVTDTPDDKMEVAANVVHAELHNIGDISKVNPADESFKETLLKTDVVTDDKMEVVTNVLDLELPGSAPGPGTADQELQNGAEIPSVNSKLQSTGIETQVEDVICGVSSKELFPEQSHSVAKIESKNINANESTLNTVAMQENVDNKTPQQELTESSITKDGIVSDKEIDTSSVQLDNAAKMSPAKVNQPQVSYTSPTATKPPRRVQLITLSTPPKIKDAP